MNPILEKVYQIGIVPVIAFNSVDEALPLCKALADGGLPAAEVTFRTACAEECIRKIHDEMPEMLLGAGTVLTTDQADRAIAADMWGKVKANFQPIAIAFFMFIAVDNQYSFLGVTRDYFLWASYILMGIATILTIISGINYVVKNRKVFGSTPKQENPNQQTKEE